MRQLLWWMRARHAGASRAVALAPPPSLDSVTPTSGPQSGGTTITLRGNILDGVTRVTVGGVEASFARVNTRTLTAVTPAGTGSVSIAVQSAGGVATLASAFAYILGAPTVTSISPPTGPLGGGQAVTLTGTNFTGATSAAINGVNLTSFVVVNDTTITGVTPAGTAGARNVTVTGPGGTGTLTNGYTYVAAPTVTSVAPSLGPLAGGQAVTITGTGFTGATSVTFGGAPATSIVVVNATTITCVTPARSAGLQTIAVTTPGGTGSNASVYTYAAAPTVTGVTPDTGRSNQTQAVTITGTGFTGATAVTIGGNAATSVVVVNDTSITCTTPTGTAGSASVQVTTPAGTGSASAYFYLDAASLELWYRPDLGLTQSSNRVSAWANQSGSGDANRNLTQASSPNQPRFVASNANFNNRPTVGTLTTSDEDLRLDTGTFSAAIGTTATVYHVFRIPSGFGNNVALRWGLGTYANAPSLVVDTGLTTYQSNDGTNLLSTTIAAGTAYVACSIYNGASGQTFLSRHTTAAVTGNAGSTTMNTLRLGTIPGFATRYETAEVIVYAGVHSQAKRQEIMAYLGTRYGITVTA